jgi:hypothetical protein
MRDKTAAKSPRLQRTKPAPWAISKSDQISAPPHGSPNVGFAICGSQLRVGSINSVLASMNGTPVQDPFSPRNVKHGGQNDPFPQTLLSE